MCCSEGLQTLFQGLSQSQQLAKERADFAVSGKCRVISKLAFEFSHAGLGTKNLALAAAGDREWGGHGGSPQV